MPEKGGSKYGRRTPGVTSTTRRDAFDTAEEFNAFLQSNGKENAARFKRCVAALVDGVDWDMMLERFGPNLTREAVEALTPEQQIQRKNNSAHGLLKMINDSGAGGSVNDLGFK